LCILVINTISGIYWYFHKNIILPEKTSLCPCLFDLLRYFAYTEKALVIDNGLNLVYYISMRNYNIKSHVPRCLLRIPTEELYRMVKSILYEDFILVDDGEFDLSITEQDEIFVICRSDGSVCATVNRPTTANSLKNALCKAVENTAETRFKADPATLSAVLGDKSVRLTETEYRLYSAILESGSSYISAEKLSILVWGKYDRNLCTVYISYLRRKLDSVFGDGTLLTARGKGYRLRDTK